MSPAQGSYYPERRSGKDRRSRPTSPLSRSSLFGSRTYARRKEDRRTPHYVDRYGPRPVLVVLLALSLCILDAFFTLRLVNDGASEINPLMDFFLRLGPFPFLASKYALTSSALIILMVHKNHAFLSGRVTGRAILLGVVLLYSILIAYEIFLVFSNADR